MGSDLPDVIPGIKQPSAMPTVEMFSSMLAIKYYDSGAINWDIYVSPNHLIPIDRCNAILTELAAASVPATRTQAAAAATFLIGAYRATDLNDPRIFTRILAATLQEYPVEIAIRAVDDLTRTSRWLPSRAELVDACQKRMDERYYAKHVVKKHLEEHAEIEREREHRKRWLAERAKHYDDNPHHRVIDRWWPLFPAYRQNRETWEWRIKSLIEEFGEPTVNRWHQELMASDVAGDYPMQKAFHRLSETARQAYPSAPAREQQP